MMISTKGKYALQTMIDLAQQAQLCACEDAECTCVSLKAIAERQNISMKYLEAIVGNLKRADLLDSTRGKEGGYKLSRLPEEYTVGEVLRCMEGSLAPVSCVKNGHVDCANAGCCLTAPMWVELDEIINSYLDSITLAQLISGEKWKKV